MKTLIRNRAGFLVMVVFMFASAHAYAQGGRSVVFARKGDVIKNSLPQATNFFVKKVILSDRDKAKIKAQGSFSPQVSQVKFFYGEDAAQDLVGTVLFNRMVTSDGTIEVGVAFTPGGTVSNVVGTRAASRMKPWIEAAVSAGVVKNLIGLGSDAMSDPMKNISESELGARAYTMAKVITAAVIHGVVYYDILFKPLQQ
jgi:hypothetical protein